MKVKKVAVTAAVCAALMGSQASLAEEQLFPTEGMNFAFDDAKVSSVGMSELSGMEMDATEGEFWPRPIFVVDAAFLSSPAVLEAMGL